MLRLRCCRSYAQHEREQSVHPEPFGYAQDRLRGAQSKGPQYKVFLKKSYYASTPAPPHFTFLDTLRL